MGILTTEQIAAIEAEDQGQASGGAAPEPEAPATETAGSSPDPTAEAVIYEEAPSPEPEQPAPARPSFKAKVYGREEDVPVFLEDGKTINPEIAERWQKAGAFYQAAERAAQLEKELEELRGQQTARPPEPDQPPPVQSKLDQLKAIREQLPADDPYVQILDGIMAQVAELEAGRQQSEQAENMRRQQEARRDLERTETAIREKYQADDNYMQVLRQITFARWNAGENVPMEKVAEEFDAFLGGHGERKINAWKEKHLVKRGTPPGNGSGAAPAAGGPTPGALSLDDGSARRAALAFLESTGQ